MADLLAEHTARTLRAKGNAQSLTRTVCAVSYQAKLGVSYLAALNALNAQADWEKHGHLLTFSDALP